MLSQEASLLSLEKEQLVNVLLGLVKRSEVSPDALQARLPEPRIEPDRLVPTLPMEGLRFAIGQSVECRMGPDEWARGKVIGQYYREDDWPQGQKAPYQVLLSGDSLGGRTVWAPSDTDECIRAAVRFDIGERVQCCVGNERWVRGTVAAHYYRETDWPAQLLAPYRVLLDERVDGHPDKAVYLWAPLDSDECIRAAAEDGITAAEAEQLRGCC